METTTKWDKKDSVLYDKLIDLVLESPDNVIDEFRLKLDEPAQELYDECNKTKQLTMAVLDSFSDDEINEIRLFARRHSYLLAFHDFQNILAIYIGLSPRDFDISDLKV